MDSHKPFLWPLVLIVVALGVAASMLFLLKSAPSAPPSPASAVPSPAATPSSLPGEGFSAAEFSADRQSTDFIPQGPASSPAAGEGVAEASWEKPISELLDSDDENDVVAAKLAALGPTLPLEGQVECVQHMVNLLEDEQYKMASDMLLNPSLLPQVREVIFSDVLDRPNEVKAPVLLALLGSYGHPLQAEAREKLQLLVGRDLGADPAAWQGLVSEFVSRSAAEEAAADAAAQEFEEPPLKGGE